MASELNVLGHRLDRISERNRWTRDFTLNSLTHALREVIAGFRVYRSYVQPGRILERDRTCVEDAVLRAKRRNPAVETSLFDFVQDVLLLQFHAHADEDKRRSVERFVGKFQQLTGPIMAKAVEDTTCYRFNRLVSLNEVGGEPTRFGVDPAEFHEFNASRLPRLSHSLNATSTHDTKRSEDVRARINVLSEIPREWRRRVQTWSRWNRHLKVNCDGTEAPSRNAEYLLYQTIVGTWPGSLATGQSRAFYVERLQRYMLKVVREAKVHTSWVNPNRNYESSIPEFVAGLFDERRRQPFLSDMHEFATVVADHGCWNSLSQLVLKVTSPGVADFYQGSEIWNLSLVDPDNRQPQDFTALRQILDDLLDEMAAALGIGERCRASEIWLTDELSRSNATHRRVQDFLRSLIDRRADGRIKLFTMLLALHTRRRFPHLLTGGTYEPLTVQGRFAENVVAFARHDDHQCIIVVAPRLTVRLTGFGGPPPLGDHWEDTVVVVPVVPAQHLQNVFSRQIVPLTKVTDSPNLLLPVGEALRLFNVAILRSGASH
jgi:(1->4)-alpha-D-glucan 1-alpha-D-glucosylmutase